MEMKIKLSLIRIIKNLASVLFLAVLLCNQGCSGGSSDDAQSGDTPEEILKYSRLDLLTDEPYYFPATGPDVPAQTFQILRKWDIIFAGGLGDAYESRGVTSRLIPGQYDHVLVYLGKDVHGNAYAAELNIDTLQVTATSISADGGIRLYCLGTDYGKFIHPSGADVFKENYYSLRWAKTFKHQFRQNLGINDLKLTSQVRDDLEAKFPYQLEFNSSLAMIFSKKLVLVDDGRLHGAGCADYWTSLFEDSAKICIKDVRLKASDVTDYFLNDPEGKSAVIPASLNPFGSGDVLVKDLLVGQGVTIVDSPPHLFSCDGSSEQGLVTPTRLFSSEQFEDPASVIQR